MIAMAVVVMVIMIMVRFASPDDLRSSPLYPAQEDAMTGDKWMKMDEFMDEICYNGWNWMD